MIPEFDTLTEQEIELIYKAPLLVSILIAGADGKIDQKEIRGAILSAEKKHGRSLSSVAQFFKEISYDYEDKLKILIQGYPYESTQRNPLIVSELSELNAIWPKLETSFSSEFHKTLLTIAEKIAKSSGGLFGLKKIGEEEARYMTLPMIKAPTD